MEKVALVLTVWYRNQDVSQSCEISGGKVKYYKLVYFLYFCNNCFFMRKWG